MKKTCKRIIATALAGTMALSFSACTGGGKSGDDAKSQVQQQGKLFTEPTKISITIGSHESWPYNPSWAMWKYFAEATGATFDIKAVPNTDYDTKVNLMMTSPDSLPDLLHLGNKYLVDQHAQSGAFISLTDNMDKMTNFEKFVSTLPENEAKEFISQRKSGDGKVYFAPVYGTQTVQNLRSWIYRKDVFEKNNLKVPTNLDEMFDVASKLKAIYPNSYPLCFRKGLQQIDVMGPIWKNNFSYGIYYDFTAKKWCYGATDNTMKDVIAFFHKMSDAKLVPADYLTINDKSWEELISTDRGFMMPEYLVRIDFFNNINRKTNKDYTWAVMAPPAAATAQGQPKIAKLNMDPTGYVVCNTKDDKRINNAIKLIDWMYSDEGSALLSWGKEGETYKIENGKKKFILGENETAQSKYGVATYGLLQRTDVAAYESVYSDEQIEQGHKAYTYTEEYVNPTLWLALNEEEMQVRTELFDSINTYTIEMLSKFMLKQEPMSNWDKFQKNLKDMGLERLLGAYESAYSRIMNDK